MPAAAEHIAAFLANAEALVPDDALAAAQLLLLNGLRATLAAKDDPVARKLIAAQTPAAPGAGAPVLWSGVSLDPDQAAACNQFLWTLLLLDDVELVTGLHPGGPASLAALAAAGEGGVSGRRFLAAIVAASEVQLAFCHAAQPEMLADRGFAPISVLAPVGAAAAASVVLRAPMEIAAQAQGMAAMSGIGVWEMGGTSSATFLTGRGVALGLSALKAAMAGVEGPPGAIDGAFGAWRAYTGKSNDALTARLSELAHVWRTRGSVIQPYSGDTFSQAPLDAVKYLTDYEPVDGAAIDEVVVRCCERTALGVGRKFARHPVLHDALALNSDPPARIAAALLRDVYSWNGGFDVLVRDAEVQDLRNRVSFVGDPAFPDFTGAAVEVILKDGKVRTARVDSFRGTPDNPQTFDDVADLFHAVADETIGRDQAEWIVALVHALPESGDTSPLIAAIS